MGLRAVPLATPLLMIWVLAMVVYYD